jgi:hypothetical protein
MILPALPTCNRFDGADGPTATGTIDGFHFPAQVYTRPRYKGETVDTCPQLFRCHPNLDDGVNRNIVESEIEGGAFLADLPARTTLQIQTQHRWYTMVHCGQGRAWIWGHPAFCPTPVLVRIEGSSWGGSMLKIGFVGRGMHLEFRHPGFRTPIVTSRILEIRQCEDGASEIAPAGYETRPAN